jgi:Rieske 2Fe-2S family protein
LRPLPFSRASIDAVLGPLESASPLPPAAYWDAEVFAFERAEILDRAWRCVGREDEIEQPGAWINAPLTDEGIVVIRGADLEARAFHNVCRHRGATLLDGPCGRVARIECPYHGWIYELGGALRSAPHALPGFDRRAHALHEARVAAWQGFLFVNLDDGAPPLDRALAGAPPWFMRERWPRLKRAGRASYEVLANWKLCVENFQESHHFPLVHPTLHHYTPCDRADSVLGDGPWLGGVMDLIPEAETVSTSGTRGGRPFLVPEEARRRVTDAVLFPTLLTSLQPDYLLTYRLHPRAPDRTLVIADTYVHPAAAGDADDVLAFWERINAEDRAVCERQQIGVRSRRFAASCYVAVEDGVHAFDRMIARRYAAALAEGDGA